MPAITPGRWRVVAIGVGLPWATLGTVVSGFPSPGLDRQPDRQRWA